MAKLFSILFSFLIFFQTVIPTAEDLGKIAALIEHAKFHSQEYGDDFFEFIALHYGDLKKEHNSKHQEHDNLPFKHQHSIVCHQAPFIISHFFVCIENTISYQIPFKFFYKESSSLFEKHTLLQPPKAA